MANRTTPTTLSELIAPHADDAPAISAIDRPTLTYGGLRALVDDTVAGMNRLGVGRGDRVAIVLANGPAMATAFVALGAGMTTAPLNPAYREEEYDFYLGDLGAKALVVADDYDGPALKVARARGIAVIRPRVADDAPAGRFTLALDGDGPGDAATEGGRADADDIALVLHTSGTTSRPKIVPLLQRNVTASACHIVDTLALTPADHCLNVMPLFHIHGLIAAVLASLKAGAQITCTPGFNALQFFSWLGHAKPTWYTGVPTMHQAILSRAGRNADVIAATRLRFIRSSSASLPPQVMAALEETFSAPVIESYGMTEASHQMASNPLPPGVHKAGSVGLAAGPKVRLADEADDVLLPVGAEGPGEVVISGPNVTPGYEANPEANAKSFFNADDVRWFRTGDQGMFDSDGYLRITGRLKEIINRGGEKVSPLEVDEVLLDHPAVAQVVTFGLPHDKLGEEVAAAVVLGDGVDVSEREIREFAAGRLADFKVPRKVVIVDEIPKGATGKMQRIGMAEKLGLTS
jgi:acyl-CoA synthetase (AMP-forming)/AMP-acid ligase II